MPGPLARERERERERERKLVQEIVRKGFYDKMSFEL